MNFLIRVIKLLTILVSGMVLLGCSLLEESDGQQEDARFDKEILRIQQYSSQIPADYKMIDWSERAFDFDELVFDKQAEGLFLPLSWEDETYDSFGLAAYVGDGRSHQDGGQEAVTNVATIISATLNGIDKAAEEDYVAQLSAFYSEEEGIILNNPNGNSASTSMWYLLYPTILFAHASDLYEEHDDIRNQLLTAIESWYGAYEVMYSDGDPDFDYTGFDFKLNEPYRNDVWTEPDSAVGIGLLMYYGYQMTEEEKYLTAAINTMDYIESYFGSPLYEALMYFGPYLAAKLNAFHGTQYDLTSFLNDNFNASSIPRGGWGSVSGQWGEYEVNGLYGSDTDGDGYVFSMNTFAAAGAIAPVVQYDTRYAKDIGVWLLHLASNSRYYFATETTIENQSLTYSEHSDAISDSIKAAIPYEGIRRSSQGRTPWFGGDPTVYDWAETDFSLYSGAHIGILGSLVEETNVEKILRLDLQATQFFNEHDLPTYLIYNPYEESNVIEYQVTSEESVDLYNSITNERLHSDVSNTADIEIAPDTAVVIIEIPSDAVIEERDSNFYVDGKFLSQKLITANITNLENNESVSGRFTIDIGIASNYDSEISQVSIELDEEVTVYESGETIELDTRDFSTGNKRLFIDVETVDGRTDTLTTRLSFE